VKSDKVSNTGEKQQGTVTNRGKVKKVQYT